MIIISFYSVFFVFLYQIWVQNYKINLYYAKKIAFFLRN